MTTKPDSTTLCSCASPRPTRSLSPTHPSPPTPTAQTTRYATWIWMEEK